MAQFTNEITFPSVVDSGHNKRTRSGLTTVEDFFKENVVIDDEKNFFRVVGAAGWD